MEGLDRQRGQAWRLMMMTGLCKQSTGGGEHVRVDILTLSKHRDMVYTFLEKAQARWARYILPIEDESRPIPKLLLYGELTEGRHQVGRLMLRFKDRLQTTLKKLEISVDTWETLASDRRKWRSLINKGAKSAKQSRKAVAESKRAARKARTDGSSSQPLAGPKCATCGRQWGSPSASDPRAKNTGQRATKGTVLTSQSLSPWCDCRRLGSTLGSWRWQDINVGNPL